MDAGGGREEDAPKTARPPERREAHASERSTILVHDIHEEAARGEQVDDGRSRLVVKRRL